MFECREDGKGKGFCSVPREFWNPQSRVGRAFREFGYDDHSLSEILLKNFVAAAIQVILNTQPNCANS